MANKIYKCNKCGMESPSHEMIPKEHGYFENPYNTVGKLVGHKKCPGTFALVSGDEQ